MILTRSLIRFTFFVFLLLLILQEISLSVMFEVLWLRADRGTQKELLNLIWTYGSLRKIRTYASELATRCLTRYSTTIYSWAHCLKVISFWPHDAIALFRWLKQCLPPSVSYRSHTCRLEKTIGLSTPTWKENGMWGLIYKEGNMNRTHVKGKITFYIWSFWEKCITDWRNSLWFNQMLANLHIF